MKTPQPAIGRSSHRLLASILAAAAAIFVQTLPAQITPGLLGTRYFEASLFAEDIRESGIDTGTGLTFRVNVPLRESLDLNVGALLEKIDAYDFDERQLTAALVLHGEAVGLRPFADLTLGGVWQSSRVDGVRYRDSQTLWSVGAGLEAPVADTTALVGRIAYHRFFSSDAGDYWLYTLGANHRLSEKLVILGAVTFREQDSIYYSLGLGLKF